MKPVTILIAMAVVGGLLVVSEPLLDWTAKEASPGIEAPQRRLLALVGPIQGTLAGDDAAAVAAFCTEFADVLERDADSQLIADTADLHDRLKAASVLMFQATGIDERHPDLPATINQIVGKWMQVIGEDSTIEVVDLDGEKNYRGLAIEAFRGIAWAAEN